MRYSTLIFALLAVVLYHVVREYFGGRKTPHRAPQSARQAPKRAANRPTKSRNLAYLAKAIKKASKRKPVKKATA